MLLASSLAKNTAAAATSAVLIRREGTVESMSSRYPRIDSLCYVRIGPGATVLTRTRAVRTLRPTTS
jgi:hypothetical protein